MQRQIASFPVQPYGRGFRGDYAARDAQDYWKKSISKLFDALIDRKQTAAQVADHLLWVYEEGRRLRFDTVTLYYLRSLISDVRRWTGSDDDWNERRVVEGFDALMDLTGYGSEGNRFVGTTHYVVPVVG